MTNEELKQLTESNARAAQAILESMAEARHERQELRSGMVQVVQEAMIRITTVQEGIARLLSILDDDRPTILRKLPTIEKWIDC